MTSIEGCSLVLSSMESTGSEVDLAALVGLTLRFSFVWRTRCCGAGQRLRTSFRMSLSRYRASALAGGGARYACVADSDYVESRARPEAADTAGADGLRGSRRPGCENMPADEAVAEARQMQAVLREIERLPKGERDVLLLSALESWGRRRWRRCWGEASLLFERCCFGRERGCASGSREEGVREEEHRRGDWTGIGGSAGHRSLCGMERRILAAVEERASAGAAPVWWRWSGAAGPGVCFCGGAGCLRGGFDLDLNFEVSCGGTAGGAGVPVRPLPAMAHMESRKICHLCPLRHREGRSCTGGGVCWR